MKINEEQNKQEETPKKQKVILTLLAQQYGLTVEDLVERGTPIEDIEVEK